MSATLPAKTPGELAPQYAAWIDAHYATEASAHCNCGEATVKMVEVFPELKRVRGFRQPGGEHWWCETVDGKIVDPTYRQYEGTDGAHAARAKYHALDEEKPQPTGYCEWCKAPVYDHRQFCAPLPDEEVSECEQLMMRDRETDLVELGFYEEKPGVWKQRR